MHNPHFAYLEYASRYQKPFVTYQLPESKTHITLILDEDSVKEFTDYDKIKNDSGFIFTPFNLQKNASYFITPKETIIGDKGFRGDLFLEKTEGVRVGNFSNNNESQSCYKDNFEQMLQLLKQKELEKIILSRTITISNFPSEEKSYTYYGLAENYPKAMVYWVHLPHLGIEWMGATPETLVVQKEQELFSLALAGTKKEEETWSNKEREEQQMVADYIAKQLKEFAPVISDTYTLDTGTVQHLATDFKMPNTPSALFSVIDKLHPTPAICGLPQQKAFEEIMSIENHDRGYYCGFLGPLGLNGVTATFVNLRCMELTNDTARLYVGGGLTKDSDFEREWQETERKAETLRKFLI